MVAQVGVASMDIVRGVVIMLNQMQYSSLTEGMTIFVIRLPVIAFAGSLSVGKLVLVVSRPGVWLPVILFHFWF